MSPTEEQHREIHNLFQDEQQLFRTYERMLNVLAALKSLFSFASTVGLPEIANECEDFLLKPRLRHRDPSNRDLLKPDALAIMKENVSFFIELKSAWDDKDIKQIQNYAEATVLLDKDGKEITIDTNRYIAFGYSRRPGEERVNKLAAKSIKANSLAVPIIFEFEMLSGIEGTRVEFRTLNEIENSHNLAFAQLFSEGSFSIPVVSLICERSGLHSTNDPVPACYAAVLWWQQYARELLSEQQKSELSEQGRLSSPIVFSMDELEKLPAPSDVQTPLELGDIKKALDYLEQAHLVTLKVRKQEYQIFLKKARTIQLPRALSQATRKASRDLRDKIIRRYAYYKVMAPGSNQRRLRKPSSMHKKSARRNADGRQSNLFPN